MNDLFMLVYSVRVLPIVVLDFDGTVCLGDAPVRRYADEVVARTGPIAGLDGALANGAYPDGYAAVAAVAGPHTDPATLQEAYLASRGALAGRALDIATPAGLPAFLGSLRGRARRVLVTNAPSLGIAESLEVLGLDGTIDEIHTGAGKPAGLPALLRCLLGGAPAHTLMSVGDFWVNDIEPALAAGCGTAFVTAGDPRPAHLRAATLPELYPALNAWVTDPTDLPLLDNTVRTS
jgi:phosphoglycolate phosphatase-like HAD superfamily hydrolase